MFINEITSFNHLDYKVKRDYFITIFIGHRIHKYDSVTRTSYKSVVVVDDLGCIAVQTFDFLQVFHNVVWCEYSAET